MNPTTYRGITVPPEIQISLDRYARQFVPVGGFLTAILANDLMDAIGRADANDLAALPAITGYIYNQLPHGCHGSYEIVDEWLARAANGNATIE